MYICVMHLSGRQVGKDDVSGTCWGKLCSTQSARSHVCSLLRCSPSKRCQLSRKPA